MPSFEFKGGPSLTTLRFPSASHRDRRLNAMSSWLDTFPASTDGRVQFGCENLEDAIEQLVVDMFGRLSETNRGVDYSITVGQIRRFVVSEIIVFADEWCPKYGQLFREILKCDMESFITDSMTVQRPKTLVGKTQCHF